MCCLKNQIRRPKVEEPISGSSLLLLPRVLSDVHNFVLEDEEVGRALAGQPHHVSVVILDPSMHDLAVHQLDRNRFLLFTDRFEKAGFFEGIFGRWRAPALLMIVALLPTERHAGIVHNVRGTARVAPDAFVRCVRLVVPVLPE